MYTLPLRFLLSQCNYLDFWGSYREWSLLLNLRTHSHKLFSKRFEIPVLSLAAGHHKHWIVFFMNSMSVSTRFDISLRESRKSPTLVFELLKVLDPPLPPITFHLVEFFRKLLDSHNIPLAFFWYFPIENNAFRVQSFHHCIVTG